MKSQYSRSDKILHEMLTDLSTIIEQVTDFEYRRKLELFEEEVEALVAAGPRSRTLDTKMQLGYCMQTMEDIREKHKRTRKLRKTEDS